jgi:hypothetical protein
MAPHDGEFDIHHNSRVPDLNNNVEAPQRAEPLAMSIPDIATDLSLHSFDTVPSSRVESRGEKVV